MFDSDQLDAGFVVVSGRSDAEGVLESPGVSLLPFALVIAACCWAVQHLRLRPRRLPGRVIRPVDEVPPLLWALFALPCVLWSIGVAMAAFDATAEVSFQLDTGSAPVRPIVVWMLFLIPGIAYFATFFHSTASNRVYLTWSPRRSRTRR